MLSLLALTALLAHLTTAQDTTSTTSTVSSPLIGETITGPSTTETITPIGPIHPTLNVTDLSTLSTISNHIVGPTHTVPLSVFSSACEIVTAGGGEPVFTIQTDTHLASGCTVTVFSSTGVAGVNGTATATDSGVGTQSVTSSTGSQSVSLTTSGTAASQTTNAAERGGVAKEGLGLAALGAAVLFL